MSSLGFFKLLIRFITSFFLLSLLYYILVKTLYPDTQAIFSQAVVFGLLMALGYTFLPINYTVWQETWIYSEAHLTPQVKHWFSEEGAPMAEAEIITMDNWKIESVKNRLNKVTIACRLRQYWYRRAKFILELTPGDTLEATIKISGLVKLGDLGSEHMQKKGRELKQIFENKYLKESFLYLYH